MNEKKGLRRRVLLRMVGAVGGVQSLVVVALLASFVGGCVAPAPVEVTRIVEVTSQPIEVTRVVEVTSTPLPAAAPAAQQADEAAMAVMDRFYEAWRTYDMEKMLSLQTDDVVWTLIDPGRNHPYLGPDGQQVGSGKDQIRAMFDLHRGELGATGYALWSETDGDMVTATELWESEDTHEIDVPLISRSTYRLRDGKIAEWTWSASPESTRRLFTP